MEIENFYSIRDRQIIDLRAAASAPDEPGRLAPLWKGSCEKAPKVVALFGANASGKSNVLRALSFVAWFVRDSFSAPRGSRMPFERFNENDMLKGKTRICAHLSGLEDIETASSQNARECKYAYEVTIGGGASPSVELETLTYWPSYSSRKIVLFERNENGVTRASTAFDLKGFKQALDKILRPDVSVISTLAQLEHPFAKLIWAAATLVVSNILIYKQDNSDDLTVRHFAANPDLVKIFNREIGRIDLGISAMQVEQGRNGPVALFTHKGLARPMPMIYESEGTRQFFKLYPLISSALITGGVTVIDELDSAIHPMILPEIIRWFHDPERNPHNAQLWMSCQNASLLEDLTKEEVLFCEKDARGRTEVYGLRDIQSVRRTDNYYKKYLGGAYGAIPHIG